MSAKDIGTKLRRKVFVNEQKIATFRRELEEYVTPLEEIANGTIERSPETEAQVKDALDSVSRAYRSIEEIGSQNFSEEFWKRPEGQLLAYGYKWLMGDDLISLKAAACYLFDITEEQYTYENKWRTSMNALTCGRYGKPYLRTYYDPDSRYPMRVNQHEIVEFKKTYQHRNRPYIARKSKGG